MAFDSSSSATQIKRYHVFSSFHGPDVRQGFLSHLHTHFASKGITTFNDQEIVRGHTIGPELVQAIGESRILIVVLSEKYASSSWCLDELVEIFNCKKAFGQTVMTIFYKVDPSDVKKQRGDFGNAFEKTCQGKSEEVKQRWSKALADVATIAGEHSLNWTNEAEMIQKIATDVSKILNVTPSRDFEGMVGLEAHLRTLDSLLCLESDEVKMIGIWGPAGIGKTTMARALYNQLSGSFQLSCFMGNLKGSCKSTVGVDAYDSKLSLQNQLLSTILNQTNMRVRHLGAVKEWLRDQRVLIILDDVDDLEQLEALAKELSWFGSGSRIVVTTEDKKILKAHGIHDIYHVDFPSEEEALEILCLSAFKQSSVPNGFEELAKKVAEFCGNLPLGLSVVGSSLRGESKHEWELQLYGLETCLDRKIEKVLRVGYDKLLKKDQSLFLHIAFLFNNETVNHVTTMLPDSNLDVRNGLKTLAEKSLVRASTNGLIVMHYLLQQLGRQIVIEQSDEPSKRQFLVEAGEIRDVLANETGTGSVIGISFDISQIGELSISGRAFEAMRNLQFIRFYIGGSSVKGRLPILEDIEYLPRLRLLHWFAYPRKCLPPRFQPECLVELDMQFSNLEKLWGGTQPLANLKRINLSCSFKLKEIPNLSKATNLESLILMLCTSLVELPSFISNLHKLTWLSMVGCRNLQVVPNNINLASLEKVDMSDCSRLRSFPNISRNIMFLGVGRTKIEEVPASVVGSWSRIEWLDIGNISLKRLTHVPLSVRKLDLSNSYIERIPDCVIGLPWLQSLIVENCTKLVSIPVLSPRLNSLNANNCASLKRVSCSFHDPKAIVDYRNCVKLEEKARRRIIQQWVYYLCLPGRQVPTEFTHKATENFVTVSLGSGGEGCFSASSKFKACLLISSIKDWRFLSITCHLRTKGGVLIKKFEHTFWPLALPSPQFLTEHLVIFCGEVFPRNRSGEFDATASEIVFEFSCTGNEDKIIECGVQILKEETQSSEMGYIETVDNSNHHANGDGDYRAEAVKVCKDANIKSSKDTGCWIWLKKLGRKKKKIDAAL